MTNQANHAEWQVKCHDCRVYYTCLIPLPSLSCENRGLETAKTGRAILANSGWTQRKDLWWVCNMCNA